MLLCDCCPTAAGLPNHVSSARGGRTGGVGTEKGQGGPEVFNLASLAPATNAPPFKAPLPRPLSYAVVACCAQRARAHTLTLTLELARRAGGWMYRVVVQPPQRLRAFKEHAAVGRVVVCASVRTAYRGGSRGWSTAAPHRSTHRYTPQVYRAQPLAACCCALCEYSWCIDEY
jgi:hypothetical protein